MPRRHRVRHENPQQARYLTFSCYRRLPLFRNDAIKDAFANRLAACRATEGFKLFAWVVMPEHVHLLLMPSLPETSVPSILRSIKEPFARQVIARWRELDAPILERIIDSGGSTRFWQRGGGYDRNILRGHELPEKIRYIHLNPVRRGLVNAPDEWRWASARSYPTGADAMVPVDRPR